MKILTVDDMALIRKVIGRVVRSLGGELLEASSGREALALLGQDAGLVDVILLDWNMPGMDGLELLQRLKSDARFKQIPVIMVTSTNDKAKIISAIQAGASNYLTKPFTEHELAQKIMNCLGSWQERFSRCLYRALAGLVQSAAGPEAAAGTGDPAAVTQQESYYAGRMLALDPVRAVVDLWLTPKTASNLAAWLTGKAPEEINPDELLDAIIELINRIERVAQPMLTAAGGQEGVIFLYKSASLVSGERCVFSQRAGQETSMVVAGDWELLLQLSYF